MTSDFRSVNRKFDMFIPIPYLPYIRARLALLNKLDGWSMPVVVGLGVMLIVVSGPPGSMGAAVLGIFLGLSLLMDPVARLGTELLLALAAWWWTPVRLHLAEEGASGAYLSAAPIYLLAREKILHKLGIIDLNLSPQLLSAPR